jgi:hypothetical protein
MKEKILAYLKTKLQSEIVKYGVTDSFLSGVAESLSKTIKEEKDIETFISEGVIDTLKLTASTLQSEGDRRVSQAKLDLKTWQKDHGLTEDGTPVKKDDPPTKKKDNDPDVPAWFKSYQDKVESETLELRQKLSNFEQEKTQVALHSKLKDKIKEKGIPEWFSNPIVRNLKIDSEDKIDQLITSLEGDFNVAKQSTAEQGVVISKPVKQVQTTAEGAELGKKIAEQRNTQAKESKSIKNLKTEK